MRYTVYPMDMRPLAARAYAEEFIGDTEHKTTAINVCVDLSSGSTCKLPVEARAANGLRPVVLCTVSPKI